MENENRPAFVTCGKDCPKCGGVGLHPECRATYQWAAEVARDCIHTAWMWSRVRGRTLRAVEVSDDLFAAYEAGLTGFARPRPAGATPKPRQLPYRTAIVTPTGQPGWSLRVTHEDLTP